MLVIQNDPNVTTEKPGDKRTPWRLYGLIGKLLRKSSSTTRDLVHEIKGKVEKS